MLIDGISRQQARLMAMNALMRTTMAGERVFAFGDWPTRPELFPMLLLSAPRDRRVSIFPGTLQFNTTISLVVVGRLVGPTPGPIGEGLELLSEEITNALTLDPTLAPFIQQYSTIETQSVVTSEAKQHIGEISMTFDLTVFQEYGPTGVPLTDILSTGTIAGGSAPIAPVIEFDVSPLQTT